MIAVRMIALNARNPDVWRYLAGCSGALTTGTLMQIWWDTTDASIWLTLFIFVVMLPSSFALMYPDVHLRRDADRIQADADGKLQSGSQGGPLNPPAIAEWLVTLIIPKRRSESLLGDLAERFHRHVETCGLRRARALYWAEALRSILPILLSAAKKLGVIAAIAEIWRRSHS
jgi:hypothetical protein